MESVLVFIALGDGETEDGRKVKFGEIVEKVARSNGGERICSWVREIIRKGLMERNLLPANDRKVVVDHLEHCNYCKRRAKSQAATSQKDQTPLIA